LLTLYPNRLIFYLIPKGGNPSRFLSAVEVAHVWYLPNCWKSFLVAGKTFRAARQTLRAAGRTSQPREKLFRWPGNLRSRLKGFPAVRETFQAAAKLFGSPEKLLSGARNFSGDRETFAAG
jgi:hypothetical protein